MRTASNLRMKKPPFQCLFTLETVSLPTRLCRQILVAERTSRRDHSAPLCEQSIKQIAKYWQPKIQWIFQYEIPKSTHRVFMILVILNY